MFLSLRIVGSGLPRLTGDMLHRFSLMTYQILVLEVIDV